MAKQHIHFIIQFLSFYNFTCSCFTFIKYIYVFKSFTKTSKFDKKLCTIKECYLNATWENNITKREQGQDKQVYFPSITPS